MAPYARSGFQHKSYSARKTAAIVALIVSWTFAVAGFISFARSNKPSGFSSPLTWIAYLYPLLTGIMWLLVGIAMASMLWKKSQHGV